VKHSDFSMKQKFQCGGREWLVTDIGTRTVVAVELGKTPYQDWYGGPPYAVVEEVFDENDLPGCEPAEVEIVTSSSEPNPSSVT